MTNRAQFDCRLVNKQFLDLWTSQDKKLRLSRLTIAKINRRLVCFLGWWQPSSKHSRFSFTDFEEILELYTFDEIRVV